MSGKTKFSEPYSTKIDPVEPRYLDTKQAARYLGLANSVALALWRKRGYGPPFAPVGRKGSNRYLYDKNDLDKWISEQKLYPQRPYALESYKNSGSSEPSQVSPKKPPPKKRPAKKNRAQPDLHKVFRTVSENPPHE